MSKLLSTFIRDKLEDLLINVGDMALKRRARRIIEELNPQMKEKIIDVGCGNGYYLYLLSNLPVKLSLTGIDSSADALRDARIYVGNKKIKYILGDSSKMPFKKNSFNKVVMSEVIEHVDDDLIVMKEVYRVLKPGGVLVMTTTNRNYPFLWDPLNWLLDNLFGFHIKSGFWAGIWNQHSYLYTPKELKKVVEKAGFKVKSIEVLTYWCLPFNHYLLNLVAKLVYDRHLSREISESLLKFKSKRKPFFVNLAFWFVNTVDRLNEVFPRENGVSIFVAAKKSN